jgi:CheY-like chemotaxis protein
MTDETSADVNVGASSSPRVLCVDDDRDIAEIVQAVLGDEGYAVSCLYSAEGDALGRMVGQFEPDCVLLDSNSTSGYDDAWLDAATLANRRRRVPVVMFTAHGKDVRDARAGSSSRAAAARFAAVLEKPFALDDLLAAVGTATGQSIRFDDSPAAERARTSALVKALRQRGATEIEPSRRREWATFRDQQGALCQMYWWQGRGVYQAGRYGADGKLRMIGQFVDRDTAIEAALPERRRAAAS